MSLLLGKPLESLPLRTFSAAHRKGPANVRRWRSSIHRVAMSPHDIVDPSLERKRRHDDSRSPGNSAARTVDDDVHFREQRNWEDTWMVRQRGVHEHAALAVDSGAAGCGDGD